MCLSQSQRALCAVAAPRQRTAAVAELGEAGMGWQVRSGISPETPGGLRVDQPGSIYPSPMMGGVSDITAAQGDDLTLWYETQAPGAQRDEETRHTAEPQKDQ